MVTVLGTEGAAGAFQSIYFQLGPDYGPHSVSNYASLGVFTFNPAPGGLITLEGLLNNSVVATDTYDVPGRPDVGTVLSVSGIFDGYEVVSSGTFNGGYSIAAFDTVVIGVPEPATIAWLGLLYLAGSRRFRQA